jgi:hypothetical protein
MDGHFFRHSSCLCLNTCAPLDFASPTQNPDSEAARKKAQADRLRAAEKFMVIGAGDATCKVSTLCCWWLLVAGRDAGIKGRGLHPSLLVARLTVTAHPQPPLGYAFDWKFQS